MTRRQPARAAAAALLVAAVAVPSLTGAAPPRRPPPRPPPAPPPARSAPLPGLPVIERVRVVAGRDHVVVSEDVRLAPEDDLHGDLRVFVAFGAPGAPRAFDAHLGPSIDGAGGPDDDAFEALPVDRVPRRPPWAQLLLGPPTMAGAVVTVREAALRGRAREGDGALLRLRTLLDAPAEEGDGARAVVVRLGIATGEPLAVFRVEVGTSDPHLRVPRAEARLCGEGADDVPLAVVPVGRSTPPRTAAIAPVHAVRRRTDDLCLRYWQVADGVPR